MDEGRAWVMDVAVEDGCRLDGREYHALVPSVRLLPAGNRDPYIVTRTGKLLKVTYQDV